MKYISQKAKFENSTLSPSNYYVFVYLEENLNKLDINTQHANTHTHTQTHRTNPNGQPKTTISVPILLELEMANGICVCAFLS